MRKIANYAADADAADAAGASWLVLLGVGCSVADGSPTECTSLGTSAAVAAYIVLLYRYGCTSTSTAVLVLVQLCGCTSTAVRVQLYGCTAVRLYLVSRYSCVEL